MNARARGFTLVEVLVALGIVAIALVAGLQATAALTNNALRQSDVLPAQMCASSTSDWRRALLVSAAVACKPATKAMATMPSATSTSTSVKPRVRAFMVCRR